MVCRSKVAGSKQHGQRDLKCMRSWSDCDCWWMYQSTIVCQHDVLRGLASVDGLWVHAVSSRQLDLKWRQQISCESKRSGRSAINQIVWRRKSSKNGWFAGQRGANEWSQLVFGLSLLLLKKFLGTVGVHRLKIPWIYWPIRGIHVVYWFRNASKTKFENRVTLAWPAKVI